jgi:hypothetical protein
MMHEAKPVDEVTPEAWRPLSVWEFDAANRPPCRVAFGSASATTAHALHRGLD